MKKLLSTRFGRVLFLFLPIFASDIVTNDIQSSVQNTIVLLIISAVGGLILWPLAERFFHQLIMRQGKKST